MDANKKVWNKKLNRTYVLGIITFIITAAVAKVSFDNLISPDSCSLFDKIFYSGTLVNCILFTAFIITGFNFFLGLLFFLLPSYKKFDHSFKVRYIKRSSALFKKIIIVSFYTFIVMLVLGAIWAPGKLIELIR